MISSDARLIKALREAEVHLTAGDLAFAIGDLRETIEPRIHALRQAGFDVEFRPGFGYRLLSSPDRLIADDLWARLGDSTMVREIVTLEETGSTNDVAAQFGRQGAASGLAIFAEHQSAGRGRFGRRWESVSHAGLWFSLLLRPAMEVQFWPRLTTWTAVCVASALDSKMRRRAGIKWPNDVCLLGKKVSGILIEMGADVEQKPFAVVGIGLNVNHEEADFPPELRATATSLRQVTGQKTSRAELAADLLRTMSERLGLLATHFDQLLAEAAERSILLGNWIKVQAGDSVMLGIAEELDPEGRLVLRTEDGGRTSLSAGEVTLHAGWPIPSA